MADGAVVMVAVGRTREIRIFGAGCGECSRPVPIAIPGTSVGIQMGMAEAWQGTQLIEVADFTVVKVGVQRWLMLWWMRDRSVR